MNGTSFSRRLGQAVGNILALILSLALIIVALGVLWRVAVWVGLWNA